MTQYISSTCLQITPTHNKITDILIYSIFGHLNPVSDIIIPASDL